jgi:GNAT superfamily N-acetyltransferase
MRAVLMQPDHAPQVADIHIEGQPGTFLTRLGRGFLTALYAEISCSPYGFGVVAVEGDLVVSVTVVSTSTPRLFADMKSRRAVRLILPILPQVFKHPALLKDIWHTWRYPSKSSASHAKQPGERRRKVEAEFLFFGTRSEYRRQHIGTYLFDRAIAQAIRRGVRQISAVVDQKNERMVTGFTEHGSKYGIQDHDTVFLFGRPMYRLVMNVDEDFFNHLEQNEAFDQEVDWIPTVMSGATVSSLATPLGT